MPGARCTRGLVCKVAQKCAHEHTGERKHSDIPCAMALRLITCSPRSSGLCCHRRPDKLLFTNLTPASRRQDHTTSPSASRAFVKSASASTASHPALVTIGNAPRTGTGRDRYTADLGWPSRIISGNRKFVGTPMLCSLTRPATGPRLLCPQVRTLSDHNGMSEKCQHGELMHCSKCFPIRAPHRRWPTKRGAR